VEVLGDRVDDEQLERRARAGFGFGGEDRGGEHVGEDVEERGDIELLRQRWQSANTDTLVNYFFKYFSHDFLYNTYVASIRAGLLKKESKGWQNDVRHGILANRRTLSDRIIYF